MKCNSSNCENVPALMSFWLGVPKPLCVYCADKMKAVGDALGMSVAMLPLDAALIASAEGKQENQDQDGEAKQAV